jgi:hypothetical protein
MPLFDFELTRTDILKANLRISADTLEEGRHIALKRALLKGPIPQVINDHSGPQDWDQESSCVTDIKIVDEW